MNRRDPGAEEGVVQAAHRSADWYELFFDLVFVAVIALSAHLIEVQPDVETVMVFLLLFFPLWWAWVNLMVVNNLYSAAIPAMANLYMLAMPGPAAMAIAIANGVDQNGWLYALGAAWIRLVMLAFWLTLWGRGQTRVPLWRVLSYNLGTAALWLISIAASPPWQYSLWALAVVTEVFLLSFRRGFSDEVYERASISHSMERIGLFVVIVIGEAVYLSVTGLAAHPTEAGAAAAMFGFIVCVLLARAFFRWGVVTAEAGLTRAQIARSFAAIRDVVLYLPFFLVAALTLVSAVIGLSVEDAAAPLPYAERALLAAGIATFYLINALVGIRLGRPARRVAPALAPTIALTAGAGLVGASFAAWVTLALVAATMAVVEVIFRVTVARRPVTAGGW